MKIRHKVNGGLAEVSENYADALIATGVWERADAPKPVRKRRPRKRAEKPVDPTEVTGASLGEVLPTDGE